MIKPRPVDTVYDSPPPPSFSSGATLLDCILNGGWAENRVINIVGDRSTGKTLLAIEACANYHRKYPEAAIHYIETEAAFDVDYARAVGFPEHITPLREIGTVEALHAYLDLIIREGPPRHLVVIDSLDALSNEAELKNPLGDQGYGAVKPKLLSEFFRRTNSDLSKQNITVMVISQVRENIGVTFGSKYTRSGGKALDFYASQILWLSEIKKLTRTSQGNTRVIGINIRAQCKKNKIGPPFREADLRLLFSYGIDDVHSNLDWIKISCPSVLDTLEISQRFSWEPKRFEDKRLMDKIAVSTQVNWKSIESAFIIKSKKYQSGLGE